VKRSNFLNNSFDLLVLLYQDKRTNTF